MFHIGDRRGFGDLSSAIIDFGINNVSMLYGGHTKVYSHQLSSSRDDVTSTHNICVLFHSLGA